MAVEVVGAVAAEDLQVRETFDQARDVAAGRLHRHRHRDRIAVVFDEIQHRHRLRAGRVQGFPELTLARRAVADRDVRDFVAMLARGAVGNVRHRGVDHAGFGGAHGLETLGAGGAALRRDVQRAMAPVRRHLPATGVRVVLGTHGALEHLERRHTEREAERAIPVIGVEPVVAGAQMCGRRHADRFMAGAADLEEDQALVLELDLLVVEAPRQQHQPVGGEKVVARECRL